MAEDWRDLALCQETDPEAFFPESGGDNGSAAKQICATCPVRLACEDYALRTDQRFGIWAGHSPKELRKLRSKRGIVVQKYPEEKILAYHKRGWSARAIGTALRLHPDVVRRVVRQAEGHIPNTPGPLVPSVGAVRRRQALAVMGHSLASIAAAMGVTESALHTSLQRDLMQQPTFERWCAIYADLSLVEGSSSKARSVAARLGWVGPSGWDESTIDDPNAQPRVDGEVAA